MEKKEVKSGVWLADQGDGTYRNPILYTDYADPDVIRVGEDFYMVASSFCNMPGLPVLHSKDLVNWTVISYVVKNLPFPEYDTPAHGKGIWAPSIRYHDEMFWVFFPTPDEGIFMSKTKDPAGEWSEPVHVKKAKGWIDPCPFWDDDGNAYLVSAFAKSRIGFKSILNIARMKPDGTALLDDGQFVFDGNAHHPTIEGPKLYKRNGYYYIMAPAGGVKTGWQTILRSKNIFGPYEDKIVLHQGDKTVNGPHQGGWVELESGESWFVHFQDADAYGRITHLQPVEWVDDWPMMGVDTNGDGIGEPVYTYRKPNVGKTYPITEPVTSDEFDAGRLGLQWQWNANYKDSWYSLTEKAGSMRLYAVNAGVENETKLCDVSNLLMQKFPAPDFNATMKLDFHGEQRGDTAGLVVLGKDYAALELSKTENGYVLKQILGYNEEGNKKEWEVCSLAADTTALHLRVTVGEGAQCRFSYSTDGEEYILFGDSFVTSPGIWVGAKVGMFCVNKSVKDSTGYADMDWFRIERLK